MSNALRVGLAGLGTVGVGVAEILHAHGALLAARCGRPIAVAAVSARDPNKDRGVDLSGVTFHADARDLARDPGIDAVVEVIGGEDGIALDVCRLALERGASVVTANKALLAHHGAELAALAAARGGVLAYEAAVAGGIPIIKGVRDALAGNRLTAVRGILNGTCNFILSEMRETGRDFADVLAEAQALGYAEADPSFDVDGIDAAHKLAILAGLAFGGTVPFEAIPVEGIRRIAAADIAYADQLGYRIKLLGIAAQTAGDGAGAAVEIRVHPCMVPAGHPLAAVEGVFNAVACQGDFVDSVMMVGRGAGRGPTASAVVADLVDLARGFAPPSLGLPADRLSRIDPRPMAAHRGPYYLRLKVLDRPGVIADIAAAMRDHDISMESVLQRGRAPGDPVDVVIVTHDAREAAMTAALATIGANDAVVEPPHLIRIEPLSD